MIGRLAFRKGWLRKQRINAKKASIIEVLGDSMEPTLEDGCIILVDHQRLALASQKIFVVRVDDGVLIKRAVGSNRRWRLVSYAGHVLMENSDNPEYKPFDWPRNAKAHPKDGPVLCG